MDAWSGLGGAALGDAADPRSIGVDRAVFRRRRRRAGFERRPGDRQLLGTCPLARSPNGVRPRARPAGSPLFFSARLCRQRLQAVEPVPAVDGPPRRAGSRRMDEDSALKADHPARHARGSRRPVPRPHALHEPRLAYGRGHHGVAQAPRSERSGQVRLLALSPRNDERMCVRPRAGASCRERRGVQSARPAQSALSASRCLPATCA